MGQPQPLFVYFGPFQQRIPLFCSSEQNKTKTLLEKNDVLRRDLNRVLQLDSRRWIQLTFLFLS